MTAGKAAGINRRSALQLGAVVLLLGKQHIARGASIVAVRAWPSSSISSKLGNPAREKWVTILFAMCLDAPVHQDFQRDGCRTSGAYTCRTPLSQEVGQASCLSSRRPN